MSPVPLTFTPTPNPNALKCVPASPLRAMQGETQAAPRSYAAAPADDAFARALFGVAGVSNVLVTPAWFTVGKDAKADWKAVKAGVGEVFEQWARSEAQAEAEPGAQRGA